MKQAEFEIQNLKCGGCASTISKTLLKIKGVESPELDEMNGSVRFNYSNPEVLDSVKSELSKIGYPVIGDANSLGKKARSYVSCMLGRVS